MSGKSAVADGHDCSLMSDERLKQIDGCMIR